MPFSQETDRACSRASGDHTGLAWHRKSSPKNFKTSLWGGSVATTDKMSLLLLLLMSSREMKDQCRRLEPGCSALYTWQDPAGKRELIWKCPDKDKDFKDELIKVIELIKVTYIIRCVGNYFLHFLLRVSILMRDIDIAILSVCLSVCLSVTFRYQMKTA